MTPRDPATAAQIRAANPGTSTWLSANAGSGKTSVLTNRVARLLLDHVPPQRILCLTYTKAAASEMQNRLFKLLGSWAMAEDEVLARKLAGLGVEATPSAEDLARARRLFAQAIEAPGGLKIQTIHSFCAALLRRFPLEAGVTPDFAEMDDRAATLLREEIVEDLATGPSLPLVDAMARQLGGGDFATLTAEIAGNRAGFETELTRGAALARFGLPAGLTRAALVSEVLTGAEAAWWPKLIEALKAGSKTDLKAGHDLSAIDPAAPGFDAIETLEGTLLFGKSAANAFGAKIGKFPTKATQSALGAVLPDLEDLMERVAEARPRRLALQTAERTLALHRFARAFLALYARRKADRGWLDFDDLILRAAALLTDPSVAQWVLFRLDGGIDHILVDEAQDTSPAQWQVIALLAQEFTAGRGAREVARTIFVVGDKKQSIYSFQGADLSEFDRMQAEFAEKLAAASLPLARLTLDHSFRSSPALLRLVDLTFDERTHAGIGGEARHLAFHEGLPGRADLWPVIPKAEAPEDGEWFDPVDRITETHHTALLARRIAGQIAGLLAAGTRITVKGEVRPLSPGDVLILVQRRSELFHEIIRALKSADLPVAGADRLKLGGELAVKDLAALLNFIALDADDLSLAATLRSPLFGWSEARLYALAQPRKGLLWEALRDAKSAHVETFEILTDLRDAADFLRPYDLIERILTRHDGRRKLIARLGPEAEDGIDSLLAQALAYERMEVPSLTGFLVWLESGEVEVKRRPDAAGDRIRVMTVHGAKGLEAPLVILPDTMDRRPPQEGRIIALPDGPAWRASTDEAPDAMADAKSAQARRLQEERLRLLYVAMTRAQSWLITCGAGDDPGPDSWYGMIRQGMEQAGATPCEIRDDSGPMEVLRLAHGTWPEDGAAAGAAAAEAVPLPGWAARPAPPPVEPPPPLSPSDLGGAKALPGEAEGRDAELALRRGRQLHLLFEHLPAHPQADWPALAGALLSSGDDAAEAVEIATRLAEARRVLTAPALAPIFATPALTEVEIAADFAGRRLLGAIDRLIVAADYVLAIDYKSNAVIPDRPEDVPEGILRQMAAYGAALAQVYPGRRIALAVLWTQGPSLMELPPDIVARAAATTSTS
ncbi:double-strand break repair helicase AddA [Solirhodobacter olei]|uniref:double-strand break repair helicase AddA n=1 Tax=Solirhodobacter olei TaxID=2493082 RepID=UPI000FDBAE17|nr:double-strand break repair helicase AddA [Solirhodobacter olei]